MNFRIDKSALKSIANALIDELVSPLPSTEPPSDGAPQPTAAQHRATTPPPRHRAEQPQVPQQQPTEHKSPSIQALAMHAAHAIGYSSGPQDAAGICLAEQDAFMCLSKALGVINNSTVEAAVATVSALYAALLAHPDTADHLRGVSVPMQVAAEELAERTRNEPSGH